MNKIEKLIQELCPEGVSHVPLGEVAELKRGSTITKTETAEGNVPVIAGGQKPAYWHNKSNRDGETIVVAGSGAYAGFVTYWDRPIFVSDAFTVSPIEDILMTKYVFHFMLAKQTNLHGMKQGSGVPHVYPRDAEKLKIPVPPLRVQQEIVLILDKFTELEAELEAELEVRRRQFDHLRSELVSAFSGSGVETVKFGEVASIVRGASPRPIQSHLTTEDNGVSWIKIGDVDPSEKYITKTAQMIKPDSVTLSRQVKPGDFVLSNSMSFGRPYISKINGCIHDGWLAISDFQERLDSDYLYHLLRSDFIQDELRKRASNGTVSNLNAEIVKNLELPLPPLEKQTELAARLDSFEALIGSKSQGLPGEIQARRKQYEYYRNKLLTFKELDAA